jgi:hypothetical protein
MLLPEGMTKADASAILHEYMQRSALPPNPDDLLRIVTWLIYKASIDVHAANKIKWHATNPLKRTRATAI